MDNQAVVEYLLTLVGSVVLYQALRSIKPKKLQALIDYVDTLPISRPVAELKTRLLFFLTVQ